MTPRRAAPPPGAWQASLSVPRGAAPAFEAALARADSLSVAWRPANAADIRAVFPPAVPRIEIEAAIAVAAAASGAAPPAMRAAPLAARDWVAEGLAALPPARAGRFRIRGAHHARRPSLHEFVVEAGPAFGTGHHETTRDCLRALCGLARRRAFARPLDLGCGTGILAMAAARLWRRRALAIDRDPAAVAAARANAARNGLAKLVECRAGNGFAGLPRGARYDLIAANIIARPLAALAPALAARLAPGGVAVLSGLLRPQARALLAAYRGQGLALRRRYDTGAWTTLCLGRRAARRMAGGPGFEPGLFGSEPKVLPLNYPPPRRGRKR